MSSTSNNNNSHLTIEEIRKLKSEGASRTNWNKVICDPEAIVEKHDKDDLSNHSR